MAFAPSPYDVVVIGGGPAGSACARLLALWGHRVLVLAKPIARARGLAESLPPSVRKLLGTIGVLEGVEGAGFPANRGNAVWWGSTEGRLERFGELEHDAGFQIFRPDFDELLLARAGAAGAVVRTAAVSAVDVGEGRFATVEYAHAGTQHSTLARFAVDCSGRAGVIARRGLRVYEPRHRMQAYLGMWKRQGWPSADDRTIVETYEDGWAWSLAMSATIRQVAVMVDAATTRTSRGPTIGHAYVAELSKTKQLRALTEDATLEHVWACDASLYSSREFAGPGFLLAGDAAACIDPLSSFGVKKALASGWLAAVALHTSLIDAARQQMALDFFSDREREVYRADLARTQEFARRAHAHHGHEFWGARTGSAGEGEAIDGERMLASPAVVAAHQRLRATPSVRLATGVGLRWSKRPVVRGREIVLEDAVTCGEAALRFAAGVDLTAIVRLAPTHRRVPDLYEAYCRAQSPVSLEQFLSAVSLLLSEHAIDARSSDVA